MSYHSHPPDHSPWHVEHPHTAHSPYHPPQPQPGYGPRGVDGVGSYDGFQQEVRSHPNPEYYYTGSPTSPTTTSHYPNNPLYSGWHPAQTPDVPCVGQAPPYYSPYPASYGAVYPPYHTPYSASYGSAGCAYAEPDQGPADLQYPTSPSELATPAPQPAPAFQAADAPPPAKQSEGGHDPATQDGRSHSALYAAARESTLESALIPKMEYEPVGVPPHAYGYPADGSPASPPIGQKPSTRGADRRPRVAPAASSSSSSSLAGALSPPFQPEIERSASASPSTNDDPESPLASDYTFIVTMGAPGDAVVNADGIAEDEDTAAVYAKLGRRRRPTAKRPPRKEPFLACFFCRGRKIACHAPEPDKKDQTCDQCARRHLTCEYPTMSRRGQRKPGSTRKTRPEVPFVPQLTRYSAPQGSSRSFA